MKNLLIIGAGEAAKIVSRHILLKKTSRKYRLVGFVDDDLTKKNIENIPVLGSIAILQIIKSIV